MSKGASLPTALKSLLKQPTFAARVGRGGVRIPGGRAAGALATPKVDELSGHLRTLGADASARGIGWGEWLSLATATVVTLNSPGSLATLHRVAVHTLGADDAAARAALMREVGLKCIGFIGIPKVINNLAALRAAVEADPDIVSRLDTRPRRSISPASLPRVHQAAYALWNNIYTPHSDKLLRILATSHPDLPVFIVEGEYGPLFAPPASYTPGTQQPVWEVNRLRTSLVAIAALRAQGGVGPQVTSHVWGLLKAAESIHPDDPHSAGLKWLATEDGALWAVRTVDQLCQAIEGAEEYEQEQPASKAKL